MTAVLDGRSVDTTMGFSPLEGVLMATRSGSVDELDHALRAPRTFGLERRSVGDVYRPASDLAA